MQKHEQLLRCIQDRLLGTSFVKVAYIFGAHAGKEATRSSNYEIAIETRDVLAEEFQWLWFQLTEELAEVGRVDVVHLNTLCNVTLKRRILREGKLLMQRI